MNNQKGIMKDLNDLRNIIDVKTNKSLELDLLERIIKRLDSFSSECEECKKELDELGEHIKWLKDKKGLLDKVELRNHRKIKNNVISHLQKEHKLVQEGYYMSIYMSIGISIGLVFGLTIFDNIALGMPIGMVLGMAIGTGLDGDAKKKGLTI